MNIAVLGGAGIVGQTLIPTLLQLGHRVRALQHRTKVPAGPEIVHGSLDNSAAIATVVEQADVVLLSIKPQTFHAEAATPTRAIPRTSCIISVMAGVTTSAIEKKLDGQIRVIRAMPNLPMRIGAGVVGLCRGKYAADEDLDFATQLFQANSKVVTLADETLLDAVTAMSGSGPAYFCYFVEAMTQAGMQLGLTQEQSLALAEHTCLGAGRMMTETGEDPALLRQKVSSKGGTTLAALEIMDAANIKDKICIAVQKACERAKELAR